MIGSPSRRLAFAAVGLLAGAGLPPPGLAQEAKSRPVGFLTQTIPAGQTRSFSVPFDAGISSQKNAVGRLTAVGQHGAQVRRDLLVVGAGVYLDDLGHAPVSVRIINAGPPRPGEAEFGAPTAVRGLW